MTYLATYVEGLVAALALIAYCKILGRAVLFGYEAPADAERHAKLAAIVVQVAVGLCVVGLGVLLVGWLGILTRLELRLAFAASLLAIFLWRGETGTIAFWRAQAREVRDAFAGPLAAIPLLFVLVAIGNVVPETNFDVTEYHYAYALEWAQAARVYADPYMTAEPYFANNFQVLYAAAFALHLGSLLHFLNWTCGLFLSLATYAIVHAVLDATLPATRRETIARSCALAAALVSVCSAWFQRLLPSAIDVPIGLMTAIPVLALIAWRKDGDRRLLLAAAIAAGYAIGMKLSLIALLPLYVGLLAWSARALPRRRIVALCLLVTVLGCPWYVRNAIAVGDPIPPVFNMLLRGSDPIYSRADVFRGTKDLQKTRNDGSILTLPIRLFTHPVDLTYVEVGIPAVVTATYIPLALFVAFLVRRRSRRRPGDGERSTLYAATAYPIALWLLTATEARYLVESFPLICASLAVAYGEFVDRIIDRLPLRLRTNSVVAALCVASALAALPYYGLAAYRHVPAADAVGLVGQGTTERAYFFDLIRGYPEMEFADDLAESARPRGAVLELGFERLRMYSADQNVPSVGAWAGPGRYFDVIEAAKRDALAGVLKRDNIAAVVVDRTGKTIDAKDASVVAASLVRAGFRHVSPPDDDIEVYARS